VLQWATLVVVAVALAVAVLEALLTAVELVDRQVTHLRHQRRLPQEL
jgi:hypothetical protein